MRAQHLCDCARAVISIALLHGADPPVADAYNPDERQG
jgi:hypothetical protein